MIQYSTKPKPIKYTSKKPSIESDALDEVNAIRSENQKFKDNTDANYFTVVTFNNAGQLKEFYEKLGMKLDDQQYCDGKMLARALGIEIKTPDKKAPGAFKVNSRLKNMAL